jgi:hypothetical protein
VANELTKSIVKVLYPARDLDVAAEVFTLEVEGEGLAACETVFAILNSYPDEMFCAAKYRPEVEAFRDLKRRSLSVGDVLIIDGVHYECKSMGFAVTNEGEK